MTHLNPVTEISGIGSAEIDGDRAILSLDSHGANIRLSLSRHSVMTLVRMASEASTDLLDAPQAEIVEFSQRATRG